MSTEVSHLIIGAGFGGLAAAIKLDEAGEPDFVVIEKGHDVGGTWRDNTYPGAACDVPSQLYSYSFALNPEWTSSFSPQPEIQAYIRRVAERSGVLDRFVFDTTVEQATWDDARKRWAVRTSGGEYVAKHVVSATGALSEPKLPDIEGIDTFQGQIFHSSRWNHDVDLTGKRVAVIGTGASAIQIVPEVQQVAGHLDVYQRTAPWVIPRNDRTYTGVERFLFTNVPGVQRLYRTAIYAGLEARAPAFTRMPRLQAATKAAALWNIRRGISDPELRERVRPDFQPGCKRILISSDYYPALDQQNVDLVTDPISKVTGDAIVTQDGVERPIDVLIVATGFYTTDIPIAHHITGAEGRTLAAVWEEQGMAAYKGTSVHGFPNLFLVVGPNTGLGHSSMVFIIESQVRYIVDAVRTMRRQRLATVQPTPEAQAEWNDDVQRRMASTVWQTGGCASWYQDSHGRNTTLWPGQTFMFRGLLSRFDVSRYQTEAETEEVRQMVSSS